MAVAFVLSTNAPVRAQTTEADLVSRLQGKPLYLRGAWGDDKLRFDSTGQPAKPYATVPFTIAAIDVSAVHLDNGHLAIQGERVGLEFDSNGEITREALRHKGGAEKIDIEIDGAPGTDYAPALKSIFSEDLAEMPSACSGPWQTYARAHWPGATPQTSPEPAAGSVNKVGGAVKPPRVLKQQNPKFTEAARSVQYSGATTVSLVVDADGMPAHEEIRKPAGMGLDEQAVGAVANYRFAPATRDGVPVPVEIYVLVNFQVLER